MMVALHKYKWYVIILTVIWTLALVANHFSRNSFDYVRMVMRVVADTKIDIDGRRIDIPRECYLYSKNDNDARYALACRNQFKTFIGLYMRDTTDDRLENLRRNLSKYPYGDLQKKFIYFVSERPGKEFVGIIDHYLILPSVHLSIRSEDRELVLRLARDISNHEFDINPIDFGGEIGTSERRTDMEKTRDQTDLP